MIFVELIKLVIFLFFFTVFGLALVLKTNPELGYTNGLQEDPRKEAFMEDCLSVSMNSKFYCEQTFKELTGNQ